MEPCQSADVLVDDCFSCRNTADPAAPPRERVWRTEHWRVAHAVDSALPGWLVVLPVEHVTSLDRLAPEAAAELGGLLRDLTAALVRVTACLKTYVMLLAEAEGFSHLHFHVVPRASDLPEDLRGPRIFGLLGADEDHRVPEDEQDAVARSIRSVLLG
jgi:diadenosine tetraphosphate (Ap4A) HIT family hydrolase